MTKIKIIGLYRLHGFLLHGCSGRVLSNRTIAFPGVGVVSLTLGKEYDVISDENHLFSESSQGTERVQFSLRVWFNQLSR